MPSNPEIDDIERRAKNICEVYPHITYEQALRLDRILVEKTEKVFEEISKETSALVDKETWHSLRIIYIHSNTTALIQEAHKQ